MSQDDLIKKLEKINLPQIDWQNPKIISHQQGLKLNLVNSRYFKESKIMFWTKKLAPLGVALVLALVIGFNIVQAKLQIARAMEVVENDEQIQDVMQEKGIEVKDVKIIDNKPYILFGSVEEMPGWWGSLTPESKLYFLKGWGRAIKLFLVLDPAKKAELEMKFANEDVWVVKKLCEKNKCDLAKKLLEKYQERVQKATERAEKAKKQGKDVDALIKKLKEIQLRQQEVLAKVLEKAPEQAKEAILRAMERSSTGLENAIERLQNIQQREQYREELNQRWQNVNEETRARIKERLKARRLQPATSSLEQPATPTEEESTQSNQTNETVLPEAEPTENASE